jgi:mono/diheme cytochrome c family protein
MNFLKIAILLSALTFFILACAQNNPVSNNNAVSSSGNQAAAATANSTPGAEPSSGSSSIKDDMAESREIYQTYCAGCHKEDGSGGERALEDGKKIKVPSYKSRGAMNATDEKLYDYIANGEEGEMPAFKERLSEQQMRNLVKFIRSEFQGK